MSSFHLLGQLYGFLAEFILCYFSREITILKV